MAQQKLQHMTQDEFLDWQSGQDKAYELVEGLPVLPLKMMTGTTRRHDRIVINAIGWFLRELPDGPCQPWTDAVAIKIPQGNIRRPDVSVDCGTLDDQELVAAEPKLVIEVLSPSTMNFDRVVKLGEYKRVESINTILLVDTQEPQMTVYQRDGEGWTEKLFRGLGVIDQTDIELPGILDSRDMSFGLGWLYDGVVFDQA
jgi:Uma2 family endonuclease